MRLTRRSIIAAPAIIGLSGFLPLRGAGTGGGSTFASLVSAIAPGNWAQLSLNNFSDVSTPMADWPNPGSGLPPNSIMWLWCCGAWDPNRERWYIWGGGHAGYNGNEVYWWDSTTLKWVRGCLPTQWNGSNTIPLTSDGYLNSPIASHSYNANVYLPVLDRLAVFGGAASGSGSAMVRPDGTTTGPYFFNPALADPRTTAAINGQKVGGLANSDPLGTAPAGNMWQNRDNIAGNTGGGGYVMSALSSAIYAQEGGADVVYIQSGVAGAPVVRYVPSASGPSGDIYAVVAAAFHNTAPGPNALAPNLKCMVHLGNAFEWSYWDLTSPGGGNNDVPFTPTDNSGSFPALNENMGLDWDEQYQRFSITTVNFPGTVWTLTPPSPLSATGWVINKAPTPVGSVPGVDVNSNGVYGLWRRIAAHHCFIYSADSSTGPDLWIYKPHA